MDLSFTVGLICLGHSLLKLLSCLHTHPISNGATTSVFGPLVSYILLRSLLNKWPEADPDMLELSTERKSERQSQKDCFVRPDHR